jgi:hypothetical protein
MAQRRHRSGELARHAPVTGDPRILEDVEWRVECDPHQDFSPLEHDAEKWEPVFGRHHALTL